MPIYATYSDVKRISQEIEHTGQLLKKAALGEDPTVFLSHTSKDHALLPVVIHVLENDGGKVYIDDRDPILPQEVSPETAKRLRGCIDECRKVVVLVSTNTKDSNWIPWELGLGDGKKRPPNVALFPVVEEIEESWAEQEYLGLYDRVVWGKITGDSRNQWMVWNHRTNSALYLRQWIER